ncbi:helix-turn-helix domain-containing protein [Methylocapsa aurea]|uniref:helix-turn-helix domain-containing protein n=1 Tax=Methylocapsa aurea TaxID=663610 RepID=UPI003D18DA9F
MGNPGTPSFDQLAIFLAVVDAGSFAGAARRLNRAVSVISYRSAFAEALVEDLCAIGCGEVAHSLGSSAGVTKAHAALSASERHSHRVA